MLYCIKKNLCNEFIISYQKIKEIYTYNSSNHTDFMRSKIPPFVRFQKSRTKFKKKSLVFCLI